MSIQIDQVNNVRGKFTVDSELDFVFVNLVWVGDEELAAFQFLSSRAAMSGCY